MQKKIEQHCPICDGVLISSGPEYSIGELLALWEPVSFSSGTREEHRLQSEFTQLYKCVGCELDIFFPQIIGTPNFYVDLQGGAPGSYYVSEKWEFGEALRDIDVNDKVVEIGCGIGTFLEKAHDRASEVIGFEYNQQALEIAKSKGLAVYGTGDNRIDLKRGTFDSVFSFHVLEHVRNPVAFVEEMTTWIKPGGKIGLSVPNMNGPLRFINPCVSNMPPHHATGWKLVTMQALCKKLGLTIERVEFEPLIARDYYYYSNYGVSYYLSGILPPRFTKRIQILVASLFEKIFKALAMVGINNIRYMRGQSLYVLFSKPTRKR